jgi:hypothetical protein
MRGEDCGDASTFRIPLHQPILLPRRRDGDADGSLSDEVLDPMAVWCGEVSLLPKEALDNVGMGSLFASAGKLLSAAACEQARKMWHCWSQEFKALSAVEGSRVMAADLRVQPNSQILQKNTVWLSRKTWNRFSKLVGKGTSKTARWKLFLEEVSAVRWGPSSPLNGDAKEQGAAENDQAVEITADKSVDESSAQASPASVNDLLLYDDILCDHGKVSKSKAAFLVPREMLEELLRCSRLKQESYKAHWGSCRGMQRLRMGDREHRLLGSDEVCEACCPEWATHFANPNKCSRSSTQSCMLFVDTGGRNGAPQTLEVPWEDGRTMTGSWLRKIAIAQAGCELRELYVGSSKASQRLLQDDDVMDALPATLRARVQSETHVEPEGDAFNRSIFLRKPSSVTSSS